MEKTKYGVAVINKHGDYELQTLNQAWFWACQRGNLGEVLLNEEWGIDEVRAVFNKLWIPVGDLE